MKEIADVLEELKDYVQEIKEMLYKGRIDKEIGRYKMDSLGRPIKEVGKFSFGVKG